MCFKNRKSVDFFSERERYRLSSVTLVNPTQAIEIFGNVATPFGTSATR